MLRALTAVLAAAGIHHATPILDWTPNPDHVGFYYAQDKGFFAKDGLDVSIRAPSDPATPLKLVAAGRTDFAVSYEQEVLIAAAKKLPVVAVAAVVPHPLNSFMAIDPKIRTIADLRGRRIGITGVPSDYAALDSALESVRLTRKDMMIVSVGYNLLPALLAHRVDAVLGVYRNVEGIELIERGLLPGHSTDEIDAIAGGQSFLPLPR
jgi:putative hydroxymethylpyrimidine transport system substrate-binding protein